MSKREQCDQLIDYFNHCLDEDERKSYEMHLSNCKACQEELKELYDLTSDLAFSSEPIEPNKGMKDRILNAVFEQPVEQTKTEDTVTKITPSQPESQKKSKPRRSMKWIQPLMAASLLLSLGANAYLYMNEPDETHHVVEDGTSKIIKNVQLAATGGFNGSANAAMVEKDKGIELVVQANNLNGLSGTEAYQVWLIDQSGQKFRAGTFLPNENGEGAVSYPVNIQGEHQWDQIAVTLEPTPTSKQPKGDIVLASKL